MQGSRPIVPIMDSERTGGPESNTIIEKSMMSCDKKKLQQKVRKTDFVYKKKNQNTELSYK